MCSGVELVRGVVLDRRGVAGTTQLGCGYERDGEGEREREKERERRRRRIIKEREGERVYNNM